MAVWCRNRGGVASNAPGESFPGQRVCSWISRHFTRRTHSLWKESAPRWLRCFCARKRHSCWELSSELFLGYSLYRSSAIPLPRPFQHSNKRPNSRGTSDMMQQQREHHGLPQGQPVDKEEKHKEPAQDTRISMFSVSNVDIFSKLLLYLSFLC